MDLRFFIIFWIWVFVSVRSDSIDPNFKLELERIKAKCNVKYSQDLKMLTNQYFEKAVKDMQYEMNQYMTDSNLQSRSSCVVNKLLEGIDKFYKCLSKEIKQCSTGISDKYIDLFLAGGTVTPYDPNSCTEPASIQTIHQNYANNMVSISNFKDSLYYASCEEVVQKTLAGLCSGAELSKYNGDLLQNGQFDQYINELPFYISRFSAMTKNCYV